jgi:hypothetical protein
MNFTIILLTLSFYNTFYHYVIVIICVMNDKLIEGKNLIFLSNKFFNFILL